MMEDLVRSDRVVRVLQSLQSEEGEVEKAKPDFYFTNYMIDREE